MDVISEDHPLIRSVIRRTPDGATIIFPEVPHPDEKKEIAAGRLPIRASVPAHVPALSGVLLDISQFAACEWLRNLLAQGALPVALDTSSMRKAQRPPGSGYKVKADGTTLPWSVLDLAKDEKHFTEWQTHIKGALPYFKGIRALTRPDDKPSSPMAYRTNRCSSQRSQTHSAAVRY